MYAKEQLAKLENSKLNKNADKGVLDAHGRIDLQKAFGKDYGDFYNFKGRYLVVKGGRSSKKSFNAAQKIVYNMMYYYHKYDVVPNTLVVRRFFNTHKDSTYALLLKIIKRFGVEHLWKITRKPMQMTYIPSGGKIVFKGEHKRPCKTHLIRGNSYL